MIAERGVAQMARRWVGRLHSTSIIASIVLMFAVIGLAALSMLLGSGETSSADIVSYLMGDREARADPQLKLVVEDLRGPRTLAAIIVGAGLGMGGILLQAITGNPLAETGILGVNAGAALGVVLGIAFVGAESGWSYLTWAFIGALVASALVLMVAHTGQAASPLRLVLAGAAFGATYQGVASAILLRDPSAYDRYRFWVLGSLAGAELERAFTVLPVVLGGLVLAMLISRPLSALALGDAVAGSLGHNPALTRLAGAVAVTFMAGAAVALAGPIAFLGILAPYLARAVTGSKTSTPLLASAVAGAAVLLASDVVSRLLIRPYEVPVSVTLALIGGPVLLLIVRTNRLKLPSQNGKSAL